MARATTSLPHPVSPSRRTVDDVLQHPLETGRAAGELGGELLARGGPQVSIVLLETVLQALDLRHRGRKLRVGAFARDRLHERLSGDPQPSDKILGPYPSGPK